MKEVPFVNLVFNLDNGADLVSTSPCQPTFEICNV